MSEVQDNIRVLQRDTWLHQHQCCCQKDYIMNMNVCVRENVQMLNVHAVCMYVKLKVLEGGPARESNQFYISCMSTNIWNAKWTKYHD